MTDNHIDFHVCTIDFVHCQGCLLSGFAQLLQPSLLLNIACCDHILPILKHTILRISLRVTLIDITKADIFEVFLLNVPRIRSYHLLLIHSILIIFRIIPSWTLIVGLGVRTG